MTELPDEDMDTHPGRVDKRSTVERLTLNERDIRSHARSIGEIVKTVASLGDDVKKLGEWQMTRLVAEAREEERDKALYGRLDRIDASVNGTKEDIKAMRGVWTRILWIAAGVLVPAVILGVAAVLVFGLEAFKP
jgi:hypothetical protein